jgi:hypothetical protein
MKKELFYRTTHQTTTLQLFLPEFEKETKKEREFYANRQKLLIDTCLRCGAKISGVIYFQNHSTQEEIKAAQKFLEENGLASGFYLVEIPTLRVRELINALGEYFKIVENP